jgi:hypothetical protein
MERAGGSFYFLNRGETQSSLLTTNSAIWLVLPMPDSTLDLGMPEVARA